MGLRIGNGVIRLMQAKATALVPFPGFIILGKGVLSVSPNTPRFLSASVPLPGPCVPLPVTCCWLS